MQVQILYGNEIHSKEQLHEKLMQLLPLPAYYGKNLDALYELHGLWAIAIALAIKLYDGGPVFFTHDRLTRDGKAFKIHGFRMQIPLQLQCFDCRLSPSAGRKRHSQRMARFPLRMSQARILFRAWSKRNQASSAARLGKNTCGY